MPCAESAGVAVVDDYPVHIRAGFGEIIHGRVDYKCEVCVRCGSTHGTQKWRGEDEVANFIKLDDEDMPAL